MLLRFLVHWLALCLGLFILTRLMPTGIFYDRPEDLAWAAFVLILVNTFLKPILVLLSLPLVILSLGLFLFVINAIILYTLPHFVAGFHVASFTAAFFGAIVLSFVTYLASAWDRRSKARPIPARETGRVIDI